MCLIKTEAMAIGIAVMNKLENTGELFLAGFESGEVLTQGWSSNSSLAGVFDGVGVLKQIPKYLPKCMPI